MNEAGSAECLERLPGSSDDVIVSGRREIAGVAWTLKRSVLIVLGKPGELEYRFKNDPECAAKHDPEEALPELIAQTRPHHLVGIFTWDIGEESLPAEWDTCGIKWGRHRSLLTNFVVYYKEWSCE